MNAGDQLGEAIAAASLVLAVLTALYTLWFNDVSKALGLKPETDPNDRKPQRDQVMHALYSKALPLSIATCSATLILMPRGFLILHNFWDNRATWMFDDVEALFILTLALLILLAFVTVTQLIGLVCQHRKLGSGNTNK